MRVICTLLATASLMLLSAPVRADTADNKVTASRVFVEKMGQGNFSNLDEIYGPNFVAHGGGRKYTLDEDNASGRAIRSAAPDLKVFVDRMIGEKSVVAVHWHAEGTNTSAAAGLPGAGKAFRIEGMTIFRFERGRIVEEWSITDTLSMLRQLQAL